MNYRLIKRKDENGRVYYNVQKRILFKWCDVKFNDITYTLSNGVATEYRLRKIAPNFDTQNDAINAIRNNKTSKIYRGVKIHQTHNGMLFTTQFSQKPFQLDDIYTKLLFSYSETELHKKLDDEIDKNNYLNFSEIIKLSKSDLI